MKKILAALIVVIMLITMVAPVSVNAADAAVESVITQLEEIDTLAQMQKNRDNYTVNKSYVKGETDQAIIDTHIATRTGYETYLANMFAARLAAQNAYDALTDEQKAEIDPALVAKLDNDLPTTCLEGPFYVTPRNDQYAFEVVQHKVGFGYEVSNHMVAQTIPQTFVIVDTSNGATTWTPSGLYVNGESNYEVTYCCDYTQGLKWGSDYRRINLEDADYFNEEAAKYIRAIVQTSYPYVTIDEMKQRLKDGGLSESFVDSLTRADIISAVQMAIWHYCYEGVIPEEESYYATIGVSQNSGIRYFTAFHDFTNEMWEWIPNKTNKTFDERTEYKINNLIWYLCNLDPVEATEDTTVLSEVKVGRTDIVPYNDDTYEVSLHIMLNASCDENDDVVLKVRSYSTNDDGSVSVTDSYAIRLDEKKEYGFSIYAKNGDTIEVVAEGTQDLGQNVYFYEAEGGPTSSQSLVGMAEGETPVYAATAFTLEEDVEKGLRVYKKSSVDQEPISDITFEVYKVEPEEGEELNELPTEGEVAKYAVPENLIGSIVTDETGYADLAIENDGTYLVIEKHNTEKVEKPVDPFYITIPWPVEKEIEGENGTETVIEYEYIVSVYPKNTPNIPPVPPPPPPPDNVNGRFQITKYDIHEDGLKLSDAQFRIYRPATDEDTDVEMLLCDGLQVAVTPLLINGEPVILTTDENGLALSPELEVGVYYVKEIKAPAGYIMRHDIIAVNVVSDSVQEYVNVSIGNTHGSQLPETGGIGTLPFILCGITMMALAVFLIVRKRIKAVPSQSK